MGERTPIESVARRILDLESRMETTLAVARSMVNATDPDTEDGRKAREQCALIERMLGELGELDDDD